MSVDGGIFKAVCTDSLATEFSVWQARENFCELTLVEGLALLRTRGKNSKIFVAGGIPKSSLY